MADFANAAVDSNGDYEGKQSWPAWFYGPKGQSQQFSNEEEVPEGWVDHPSKLNKPKGKEPQQPAPSPYKDKSDADVIKELKERKIDHNEKWPRAKLEALLIEDDKKKAGN